MVELASQNSPALTRNATVAQDELPAVANGPNATSHGSQPDAIAQDGELIQPVAIAPSHPEPQLAGDTSEKRTAPSSPQQPPAKRLRDGRAQRLQDPCYSPGHQICDECRWLYERDIEWRNFKRECQRPFQKQRAEAAAASAAYRLRQQVEAEVFERVRRVDERIVERRQLAAAAAEQRRAA
ncbi:hypothetical protein OH77DRAFT_1432440 [Trametes cingulata]|nr:hypothetical protein OH77DRAFT_1432440 [Trametes cingulata]